MNMNARLADDVIANLKAYPEHWTFDKYEARNERRRIVVWIANGSYGLDLQVQSYSSGNAPSFFSALFGWCSWRGRLYRAIRRAQYQIATSPISA